MKAKLYKAFFSILVACSLGLIAAPSVAEAYYTRCVWVQGHWYRGYWVPAHRQCYNVVRGYNYGRSYGGCWWVPGHWRYGYWVPGHRVCR